MTKAASPEPRKIPFAEAFGRVACGTFSGAAAGLVAGVISTVLSMLLFFRPYPGTKNFMMEGVECVLLTPVSAVAGGIVGALGALLGLAMLYSDPEGRNLSFRLRLMYCGALGMFALPVLLFMLAGGQGGLAVKVLTATLAISGLLSGISAGAVTSWSVRTSPTGRSQQE